MSQDDSPEKRPPDPSRPDEPPPADGPADPPDDGATIRLDPADLPPTSDPAATVRIDPAQLPDAGGPAGTGGSVPPDGAQDDPGATVKWSPEEVARAAEAEAAEAAASEQEEDPLIGTLIRDKWRVLKRLGAGSFGTVYKVEDVKGGWIEALKILGVDRLTGAEAEEMRARFLREAQIMKRLGNESQHIVGLATYEEDIEAGLIYFLMEFVEGRSLADELHESGPFSVERTLRLAKQVCEALMAAHEGPEPVVHRDLKLENLMLTKDRSGGEIVKVLDFGIAKIAEKDADSRLTTVGTLGTPGYAAPEQLRAEGVDGRTDLFAFGVILYALLTGRDPWLGGLAHEPTHQIYELMVATDRGEVKPVSASGVTVPAPVVNLVMKLLRRDPAQRFQSARELLDALILIEAGGGETAGGELRVLTPEPGVEVEVRSGREVVAAGPTPCVVKAIAGGTYTVIVRDPRFDESETTVVLGEGAREDVTLAPARRSEKKRAPRPKPRGRRRLRVAAGVVLVSVLGGVGYAQPWGRIVDETALASLVDDGRVPAVWFTGAGVEGGLEVAPAALTDLIPVLAGLMTPFTMPLDEGRVPDLARELSAEGVEVDLSWEVARLTDLAAAAQERALYFGVAGGDVQSYAQRLAELEPSSPEAASLLLKVAERMAWDAEVALAEGPDGRADDLLDQCLRLVPGYPRCTEIASAR